jgi:hypothetical protein
MNDSVGVRGVAPNAGVDPHAGPIDRERGDRAATTRRTPGGARR